MTLPVRRHRGGLSQRFPEWRDPFSEFDDLFRRMSNLWESSVGRGMTPMTGGMAWVPPADVSETEDAYLVEVDLPGMRREDIDIEISGQELMISGECKEREDRGTMRTQTRRTGRFEYATTLPADADGERINANLSDGVLTVTIPKTEAAKPRHIEITGGD